MNRFLLFGLVLSIGLNLFLLNARRGKHPLAGDPAILNTNSAPIALQPAPKGDRKVPPDEPLRPHRKTSFDWNSVESEDYRIYIENLRAIGCPPQTIHDIVSQDLKNNFRAKEWQILRNSVSTQYWSSSFRLGSHFDEEKLRELRTLNEEFAASHRSLLGTDPQDQFLSSMSAPEMELITMYGDLDWETVQELVPIQARLLSELRDLKHDAGEATKNALLARAQDEMAPYLSHDQQTVYELRTSRLAKALRSLRVDSEDAFRKAFSKLRGTIHPEAESDSISDEEYVNRVKTAIATD